MCLPRLLLQELWVDPLTRLPTLRHDLTIDRGMSFEAAAARLAHERGEQRSAAGWRRRTAQSAELPLPTLLERPLAWPPHLNHHHRR